MTIHLTDAQAMHRQHPITFEVPTRAELDAIKPGDSVKAIFDDVSGSERMWVTVDRVTGDEITGTLDNYPEGVRLKFGDPVRLEKRHICAIWEPDAPRQ